MFTVALLLFTVPSLAVNVNESDPTKIEFGGVDVRIADGVLPDGDRGPPRCVVAAVMKESGSLFGSVAVSVIDFCEFLLTLTCWLVAIGGPFCTDTLMIAMLLSRVPSFALKVKMSDPI